MNVERAEGIILGRTLADLEALVRSGAVPEERLVALYALATLARDCVLPPGYHYPDDLGSAIVLTDEGTHCARLLAERAPQLPQSDAHAVIFATFHHLDLLVDPHESDIGAIGDSLSREIAERRIRYGFLYGTELYDAYFERFGSQHVALAPEQTQDLLDATSQGVIQVAAICIGPLGVMESAQHRYLPPIRTAPLAHCRDPGCPGIHSVHLSTSSTAAGDAYSDLQSALLEEFGPPSHWTELIVDLLIPDERHYADIKSDDLQALLGNALATAELRILLQRIVEAGTDDVRRRLAKRVASVDKSSAEQIVEGLDRASMLQALLLVTDGTVASMLDQLVLSGAIVVPPTEIRRSPMSGPHGAMQKAELSSYGVRFDAPRLGTLRLGTLIRALHPEEDLSWQLLDASGGTTTEKLHETIHNADVRAVIRDLLLGRRELYSQTVAYLRYGYFQEPSSADERDRLVTRILWKLGFDVPDYPPLPRQLAALLASLRDEAGIAIDSDGRVSEVRSVAVNVFAALEEYLGDALAFATFALLEDHFGRPRWKRFTYNQRLARSTMVHWLSGGPRSAGEGLQLAADGRNNLFGLIHGFRELARVVAELAADPVTVRRHERSRTDYPRWVGHSTYVKFPFVHTLPMLDIAVASREDIQERLETVTNVMLSADVMGVRNRIPHGGGTFPSCNELQIVSSAIDEVVTILEATGLYPLVRYHAGSRIDSIGRRKINLADYLGRTIELQWPSELDRCSLPSTTVPQVVLQRARIEDTAECLRFGFEVESAYAEMWEEYPRRRAIEAGEADGSPLQKEGQVGQEIIVPS